jgi:hypothetical protein
LAGYQFTNNELEDSLSSYALALALPKSSMSAQYERLDRLESFMVISRGQLGEPSQCIDVFELEKVAVIERS